MSNLTRTANIALQRLTWTRRVESWDHADSPGLERVVEAVLAQVPSGAGVGVDIGAGTGRLTIPLAARCKEVVAVDVSQAMLDRLSERARSAGVSNLATRAGAAEDQDFAPGSVDVVVSNYALHHLRDPDKEKLVKAVATWLAPGGKLIVGDMMFGRGTSPRDRQIIGSKVAAMARKGPAGWWRILKNAGRFLFRVQERPISPEAWVSLFEAAGLVEVAIEPVVSEAAVVHGARRS